MKRFSFISLALLLPLALAACAGQTTPSPTLPSTQTAVLPTPPILTAAPGLGTTGLILLPTPELVDSMDGTIWADSNLRSGPGLLFDVVATFRQETGVTVTGQAPGGGWLQIADGSRSGWMNAARVTLAGDQFQLRTVEPQDVLSIKGHIYTPNGNPASHLGVSLLEKISPDTPQKDSAFTNDSGEWYLYLPPDLTGKWTVRADSYGCESNAVDTQCNLIGHFPDPQEVTLPLPADTWIDFKLTY